MTKKIMKKQKTALSPEKKQFLVVIAAICLILVGSWLGAKPLAPSIEKKEDVASVTFTAPEVEASMPVEDATDELKFYDVLEVEDVVELEPVEVVATPIESKSPVEVVKEVKKSAPASVKKEPTEVVTGLYSVETIKEEVPVIKSKTSYIVQVSSHKSEEAAYRQLAKLTKVGVKASVSIADLGEKGTWYRVLSGPYVKKIDAQEASMKIKLNFNKDTLVRKISN